jgi:large subunit ribosomal protein L24
MASKIRKGDTVEVTVGKNKGTRGTVLRVDPREGRVLVEGVNVVKRHLRPSRQYGRGGIIEKEATIHISNVALVHESERTRVGFQKRGDQTVRWSKKHGEAIDE